MPITPIFPIYYDIGNDDEGYCSPYLLCLTRFLQLLFTSHLVATKSFFYGSFINKIPCTPINNFRKQLPRLLQSVFIIISLTRYLQVPSISKSIATKSIFQGPFVNKIPGTPINRLLQSLSTIMSLTRFLQFLPASNFVAAQKTLNQYFIRNLRVVSVV